MNELSERHSNPLIGKSVEDSISSNKPRMTPDEVLSKLLQRTRPSVHDKTAQEREYQCVDCKDRGSHTIVRGGERYVELCHCRLEKRTAVRFNKARIPFEYWNVQLPITDRVLTIAHVDIKNGITKAIDINRFLEQYLEHLDENIKKRVNLLLCGNNGSGKTLASMIIAREGVLRGYSCYYITMSRYLNLRHQFNDEESLRKVNEIMDVDILVLDDVGKEFYLGKGSWTYSQIEDLFRYRFSKDAITILTSNFNLMADNGFESEYGVSDSDALSPLEKVYLASIRSLLKSSCLCLELIIDSDYRQGRYSQLWETFDLAKLEVREL